MTTKTSNILHIVNIYFVLPYFIGEQFLYFKNKGYKLHVICSQSPYIEDYATKMNFNYKEIEIKRAIALINDLKALRNICLYIKKNKIDIVVGHTPKGALLAMISSWIMRVPKRIYFRHGLVYETASGSKRLLLISMDRLAAKLATKIVCVSPSVYKRSIEDCLNSEKKQVLLSKGTCNGIDVERFNKDKVSIKNILDLKKVYKIPLNDFVIGYTGRLVRDKGIIELVEAFSIIQKDNSNITLLLVGMLEERDALPTDTVEIIKNNPQIIHTGYIDYSNVENYYALMDIFILPSYREGFPTSVLEASSMKIPIITTKATGCVDSIINNKTGVFIDHDAMQLKETILLFFNNRDLCNSYGEAGRNFAVTNFSQPIIWGEINKLYY